jgi:hypothetical protein
MMKSGLPHENLARHCQPKAKQSSSGSPRDFVTRDDEQQDDALATIIQKFIR